MVVTPKEARQIDVDALTTELAKPTPDLKKAMLLQNDLLTKDYR